MIESELSERLISLLALRNPQLKIRLKEGMKSFDKAVISALL